MRWKPVNVPKVNVQKASDALTVAKDARTVAKDARTVDVPMVPVGLTTLAVTKELGQTEDALADCWIVLAKQTARTL